MRTPSLRYSKKTYNENLKTTYNPTTKKTSFVTQPSKKVEPSDDSSDESFDEGIASESENDEEYSSEEDNNDDDDDEEFNKKVNKEAISDLSFAERLAVTPSKPYNPLQSTTKKVTFKKASKHAPSEMSSKRPVRGVRQVVPVSKNHIRDPRFDSLCGKLNMDLFEKSYSFLGLEKPKHPKQELQALKKEWRRSEMEKLSKGLKTKPYFPKASTLKVLSKVEQYKNLSDKTLEKKLEKKRKKIKSRDAKLMVYQRHTE